MVAPVINNTHIPILDTAYYTEGPAVDREGNIFFTAPAGGKIFKMDISGAVKAWARSVWPNGQLVLENGDHLVCDSRLGLIRRFGPSGNLVREETVPSSDSNTAITPNDLAVDRQEEIYFTDSIRHHGKIWMKNKKGDQFCIATTLDYPNGIVISEERRCLYVAESYKNRILKISMVPPYHVEVFVNLPAHACGKEECNLPDGLAIDEQGNLWVAHYGMSAVQIISPDGYLTETVSLSFPLVSNVNIIERGKAVITGGFAEPGPGAVSIISYHY